MPVRPILEQTDGVGRRGGVETRPAAAGVELRDGVEQLGAATGAEVFAVGHSFQYLPVKARSVPCLRSTWYASGLELLLPLFVGPRIHIAPQNMTARRR